LTWLLEQVRVPELEQVRAPEQVRVPELEQVRVPEQAPVQVQEQAPVQVPEPEQERGLAPERVRTWPAATTLRLWSSAIDRGRSISRRTTRARLPSRSRSSILMPAHHISSGRRPTGIPSCDSGLSHMIRS
jgi:hypothetical protein